MRAPWWALAVAAWHIAKLLILSVWVVSDSRPVARAAIRQAAGHSVMWPLAHQQPRR